MPLASECVILLAGRGLSGRPKGLQAESKSTCATGLHNTAPTNLYTDIDKSAPHLYSIYYRRSSMSVCHICSCRSWLILAIALWTTSTNAYNGHIVSVHYTHLKSILHYDKVLIKVHHNEEYTYYLLYFCKSSKQSKCVQHLQHLNMNTRGSSIKWIKKLCKKIK